MPIDLADLAITWSVKKFAHYLCIWSLPWTLPKLQTGRRPAVWAAPAQVQLSGTGSNGRAGWSGIRLRRGRDL